MHNNNNNYNRQNYSSQNYNSQNYPSQSYNNNQNYSSENYNSQNYLSQNYSSQNYSSQNYSNQNYSSQNNYALFKYSIFHAAQVYDHRALEEKILNGADPNITDSLQQTALHFLFKHEFRGHLNMDGMEACLKVLLQHKAINVNMKDSDGRTPLFYTITNKFANCTQLLLDNGASLTSCDDKDKTNIESATKLALSMPEVLQKVFDESVTVQKYESEDMIRLDWRPILQYKQNEDTGIYEAGRRQRETSFLYGLLGKKHRVQKIFLSHPLVSAFLFRKWQIVYRRLGLFYLLMALFPLLYLGLIYYLYFIECGRDEEEDSTTQTATPIFSTTSSTTSSPSHDDDSAGLCKITLAIFAWNLVVVLLALMSCIIFLVMFVRHGGSFFRTSWRTYVTFFSLLFMGVTLYPGLKYGTYFYLHYHYPFAALGMFFACLMFLLQLGTIPKISVYVEVLAKILLSVLKIYSLFLPLLVGFYLGFSLMFKGRKAVFGFIITTTDVGSTEYQDMVEDFQDKYYWLSFIAYTFCVTFIVIIVIVFMNFVLGTSISDIQKLKRKAKISFIGMKIQNLFTVDVFDLYLPCVELVLINSEDLEGGKWYSEFSPSDPAWASRRDIVEQLFTIIKNKNRSADKVPTGTFHEEKVQDQIDQHDFYNY